MSVYRRFPQQQDPSFITTNTHERRRIFGTAAACELLIQVMYAALAETATPLLAFAVMPDHVHLIVAPSAVSVSRTMQLIKGRFSREYNRRATASGPIWQSRFQDRVLATDAALSAAIEYVHNNPVAAGLADTPEDYGYSSANGKYGTELERYLSG
jgi:putative transposase